LFKQPGAEKLSFIGGTAIRIVHNSQRFSEDLDFDGFNLSSDNFKKVMERALAELRLKGFEFETRYLLKKINYHLYLKFPQLVFRLGLSGHREEKIFLAVDVQVQKKNFSPETFALNRFGVFRRITVNPAAVLIAQKLIAILQRKREKGRDFYDVSFLAAKTGPDIRYIEKATGLTGAEFAIKVRNKCEPLNYRLLANEVEPLLFNPGEKNRVLYFKDSLPGILNF